MQCWSVKNFQKIFSFPHFVGIHKSMYDIINISYLPRYPAIFSLINHSEVIIPRVCSLSGAPLATLSFIIKTSVVIKVAATKAPIQISVIRVCAKLRTTGI